jgi:hypothetical protein
MMIEPSEPDCALAPLYVLCVSGEQRSTRHLAEVGITSWAPTFKKLKPRVGRQAARLIDRPLIPGYVFARLSEREIAAAMATERVYGVISSNGAPKVFPEAEFTNVMMMVISGRFDDRLPATQARPRGERKRGLAGLNAWFDAYGAGEASQLHMKPKAGNYHRGGEPVSEGNDPSRCSTLARRKARRHRIRKVRSVA